MDRQKNWSNWITLVSDQDNSNVSCSTNFQRYASVRRDALSWESFNTDDQKKRNQSEISHEAKSDGGQLTQLVNYCTSTEVKLPISIWSRLRSRWYQHGLFLWLQQSDDAMKETPSWADTSTIVIFESPRDRFASSSTQASISIDKRIDYSVNSICLYTRFWKCHILKIDSLTGWSVCHLKRFPLCNILRSQETDVFYSRLIWTRGESMPKKLISSLILSRT